ncbi:MAG: hypothetical protein AB7N65_22530 [Vicinamibacterales bacterium]
MFDFTASSQRSTLRISPLVETYLNFLRGLFSIPSMPLEFVTRPRFGTCYFDPLVIILSGILMAVVGLLGVFGSSIASSVPGFAQAFPSTAVGLGTLALLFFAGMVVHFVRLLPKIQDQSKEIHSEDPGPPFPLLRLLPRSSNYFVLRTAYEPAFVMVMSGILGLLGILSLGGVLFLAGAAYCLSAKNFLECYMGWKQRRIVRDDLAMGPILADVITGKATAEQRAVAKVAHLSSGRAAQTLREELSQQKPTDLPPEVAKLLSQPAVA